MNKRELIIAGVSFIIILSILGTFINQRRNVTENSNQNPTVKLEQKYENVTYGLSFIYPEEYILSEKDAAGSGMRKHHIITLMRNDDLPAPVGGEGPTAITIDLYQNDLDKLNTEEWIRNNFDSNFKLSNGVIAATSVNDLPALAYGWTGLYEGTTVALAEPNWVYAFSVTYMQREDKIIEDYMKIRESVKILDKKDIQ